jgi:hypothetical protein
MTRLPFVLCVALSLGGLACGAGSSDPEATSLRTLTTCTTSIADDVPAFFKTYFRCVTITKSGDGVVITTKSLPPHKTAYWGSGNANYEAFDTQGGTHKINPNELSAQTFSMTVPLAPTSRGLTITSAMVDRTSGTSSNEYTMGGAGVALDSVEIFNDQAAPGDDIDDEQYTFDTYAAHPAPGGAYHYHAATKGPLEVLAAAGLTTSTTPGEAKVELFGVMCDGTLVLGCTELDGTAAPSTGLDAQNGHVTDLVDAAGTTRFTARYHTHVCPAKLTTHKYMPEIQYYSTCTTH